MKTDTLYFTAPRSTAIRSRSVEMGPEEVLVSTDYSAISAGTEMLLYRDEVPADLPADATIETLSDDLSYPIRYGYAAVGTVQDTGGAVEDDWEDTRVFAFNPHESRFVADPATLVAVPEDVSPAEMTLLPTLETATSLVLDGRPRIGERVVVFGAGVVGLLTIALLSRFPLDRLVAVEPIEARRKRALAFGADEAVSPDGVPSLFDAEDVDDPSGADLLYELSGRPAALDDALDATGYDSRVIVGSWYGTKPVGLDLGTEFHRNRISLASSQVSTLAPETTGRFSKDRRLDVALDRLREIEVASLITHRIPFGDAPDAYRLLDESPETAVQVLLTYE